MRLELEPRGGSDAPRTERGRAGAGARMGDRRDGRWWRSGRTHHVIGEDDCSGVAEGQWDEGRGQDVGLEGVVEKSRAEGQREVQNTA